MSFFKDIQINQKKEHMNYFSQSSYRDNHRTVAKELRPFLDALQRKPHIFAMQKINNFFVVVSFLLKFNFISQSPCMSNPCQNGDHLCRPIYSQDDYQCICKPGFTGENCDEGLY